VRRAEEGSAFCKKHGDAIFGEMLGALVYMEAVNEVEHLCGEGRPCEMARARRKVIGVDKAGGVKPLLQGGNRQGAMVEGAKRRA
jgi:hypothetical protein